MPWPNPSTSGANLVLFGDCEMFPGGEDPLLTHSATMAIPSSQFTISWHWYLSAGTDGPKQSSGHPVAIVSALCRMKILQICRIGFLVKQIKIWFDLPVTRTAGIQCRFLGQILVFHYGIMDMKCDLICQNWGRGNPNRRQGGLRHSGQCSWFHAVTEGQKAKYRCLWANIRIMHPL